MNSKIVHDIICCILCVATDILMVIEERSCNNRHNGRQIEPTASTSQVAETENCIAPNIEVRMLGE
ncbi:hypothetical protein [Lysobacter sp. cf310]|uniref:hypothetical protein n=1 Tax=Lysobacter sp. cf310 TaxID=1761790 RepID=UPI0008EF1709|nr:hypothetical protein [Lysobacter sp. cf310]SFK94578.1 hypothetical protein SAMN04487938_2568 [Lysobacter sp. cf310]